MQAVKYRVGCVGCGPKEELTLDLEDPAEVAKLGVAITALLLDGHAPVIYEDGMAEMVWETAALDIKQDSPLRDLLSSNWKDLN